MAQYRKSMVRGGVTIDDVNTMLIGGGYLRAKIRGLTDFDKVAGGLAWGILNSRFSIDVEFVENAHIRDKIRIAENICGALKQDMQCPHDLEPHQIQGLDYPKIVVVLEWLMKRVAAARSENAHFVAEYTKLDFERRFHTPYTALEAGDGAAVGGHLRKQHAAPKRVMISTKTSYASPLEHAATVLLEYGLKYQMKDSVLLLQNTAEMEGDAEMQRDVVKLQDDERKEQAMLDGLLAQMSAHKDKARIATSHMSSLMEQHTDNDKISKLRSGYEARRAELQQRLAEEDAARNALERQKQRLVEVQEGIAHADQQAEALQAEHAQVEASASTIEEKFSRKLRRVEEEIEGIEEIERMLRSDQARSDLLDHLVTLLDDEKQQQRKLEEDHIKSKARVAEAKEEVLELADRMERLAGDDGIEAFERDLSALREELAVILNELAKRDQEAMGVMRKIDEFPTRAELQQYQVRIGELDEEIAWKFEATRLSYTLNNTRVEIVKCLENEAAILAQVAQLVETCMGKNAAKKNVAERQLLLEQTSAIAGQLKASQIKQRERLEEAFATTAKSRTAYDALLEKQAEYHRLVADMKDCLEENEQLRLQLEEAQDAVDGEADAAADEEEEEVAAE